MSAITHVGGVHERRRLSLVRAELRDVDGSADQTTRTGRRSGHSLSLP